MQQHLLAHGHIPHDYIRFIANPEYELQSLFENDASPNNLPESICVNTSSAENNGPFMPFRKRCAKDFPNWKHP